MFFFKLNVKTWLYRYKFPCSYTVIISTRTMTMGIDVFKVKAFNNGNVGCLYSGVWEYIFDEKLLV